MKVRSVLLILSLQIVGILCNKYEDKIRFIVHKKGIDHFDLTFNNNDTFLEHCKPSEPFTILVHGFRESYDSDWVKPMIEGFLTARDGCVIFMDYRKVYKIFYSELRLSFYDISDVLTRKINQLEELGFDPVNGHMFGFSFGAQLVLESGYKFGPSKFGRIDTCDAAGPYFDAVSHADSVHRPNESAIHVQCIHTSLYAGTWNRNCQKDINMGICGFTQLTNLYAPFSDHNACPFFYIYAFTNDFPLVPQAVVENTYNTSCYARFVTPDVTLLNETVKMGYYLDMNIPNGEYFSLTFANAPHNQP